MRAIKINALKREITEIEIDGSLKDYYAAADCQMIECAGFFDNDDIIYVDEEGMMNDVGYGFSVSLGFSNQQTFLGSGVVTRNNEDGEATDCLSKLNEIEKSINFWIY